ncbi:MULTISPECIES: hypothetical protein [unclassified Janthinobacterium]|uniref:hypothetical protein n=1 Tax=unclassified Janthinobacterium TaxID=2610881 RepID=UPI00160AC279|nr:MULTISPECIES: hypothetical protein [unclassified Janthinobacterium]MBB5610681.1 hypothetical protein [Janthinobacterium sp. S3T4]MBB5616167.1 hypothetical protein [Janthinobacterium sp. S3M3]
MTAVTVLPLPAPNQLLLKISFDADQGSSQLDYELSPVLHAHSEPELGQGLGTGSGSIYFSPGEEVGLQIICSGDSDNHFQSFQIVDCTFITQPQVVQRGTGLKTWFAAPSPFLQARSAVHSLPLEFRASVVDNGESNRRAVIMDWKNTLNIGYNPGFWAMSFVMTVRIMRTAGMVEEVRVLSFDPESEVGNTGTMKL